MDVFLRLHPESSIRGLLLTGHLVNHYRRAVTVRGESLQLLPLPSWIHMRPAWRILLKEHSLHPSDTSPRSSPLHRSNSSNLPDMAEDRIPYRLIIATVYLFLYTDQPKQSNSNLRHREQCPQSDLCANKDSKFIHPYTSIHQLYHLFFNGCGERQIKCIGFITSSLWARCKMLLK